MVVDILLEAHLLEPLTACFLPNFEKIGLWDGYSLSLSILCFTHVMLVQLSSQGFMDAANTVYTVVITRRRSFVFGLPNKRKQE